MTDARVAYTYVTFHSLASSTFIILHKETFEAESSALIIRAGRRWNNIPLPFPRSTATASLPERGGTICPRGGFSLDTEGREAWRLFLVFEVE